MVIKGGVLENKKRKKRGDKNVFFCFERRI
jgi:hypothetical protein